MNSVWTRRALTAFLLAVLVICGMLLYRLWMERGPSSGIVSGEALIGGPFQLTDQDGNKVTDQTYKGKLMLIYFGFTYCPDACPTALGVMSAALDKLDVAADRVVPILLTVDPERDTPQVLKDYVSNFHPGMVGLTGTPEQIAQVAKAYRVFYQKAPGAKGEDYLMDHTLLIYLMDAEGKYVTHFGPDATPDRIADEIRKAL
jgi:cytochrome oxidase Cu insertion factor (SCO1/SenC/PrrC family)